MNSDLNRCRLMLAASASTVEPDRLIDAVSAGDVASVILYSGGAEEHLFAAFCSKVVSALQEQGAAVLIADNTQVFGRSGADGLFLEKERPILEDTIARFSPQSIVGCGGFKDRHAALQLGELKPDFLVFGKLGGDIRPEPHPKNLSLVNWWSELVEIPGVIMGGNVIESVVECAASGTDFVMLEGAIFCGVTDPAEAVLQVNSLLDEHAPVFDEEAV